MKVYSLHKGYFDGDHDHGSYRAGPFATRELAEAFRERIIDAHQAYCAERGWNPHDAESPYDWSTDNFGRPEDAFYDIIIVEQEVYTELPPVAERETYLTVTYT